MRSVFIVRIIGEYFSTFGGTVIVSSGGEVSVQGKMRIPLKGKIAYIVKEDKVFEKIIVLNSTVQGSIHKGCTVIFSNGKVERFSTLTVEAWRRLLNIGSGQRSTVFDCRTKPWEKLESSFLTGF